MSPRTGRPKAENPKSEHIKIRIEKETNEKLIKYAEKNNISRTEVIRRGIELILDEEK